MTNPQRKLAELHGGEVEWAVSEQYGIPIEKIISFASTVSPLIPESIGSLTKKLSQLYLYPSRDHAELKRAIAAYHGLEGTNGIILGCGSTELIHLFAQVICNGEVIIPVPTYSEYETAVSKYGGRPILIHHKENFEIDLPAVKRAISRNTKAIFVCNPNNPTGKLYRKNDLEELARIARDRELVLVVDEAYLCFTPKSKQYSMAHLTNSYPVLVLNSLSKLFGVPSLRLGWGIASETLVRTLESLKLPWTVSNLAAWAGEEFLRDLSYQKQIVNLVSSEHMQLEKELSELPWLRVHPSDCNFFLLQIIDENLSSSQVFDNLVNRGLVIRDCSRIKGLNEKFFRVTIRTPEDNRRLVSALSSINIPTLATH